MADLEGHLARGLYLFTWAGLALGVGLQVAAFPPRGLALWGYGVFALLFLLAFRQGPRKAPRLLTHALGGYLVFEALRVPESGYLVGFWSPAVYLMAAFGYRMEWALAYGLGWGTLLLGAILLRQGLSLPWLHLALAQPILLSLALLLARFRELKGQVRFWQEQALTDPLTGLPNRRALEMALRREAARVERGEAAFSLVLLDLDDFKKVNDQKGHEEGDRLLKEVARYLVAHVRQGDLVGRWGGEEFALLLPHTHALQADRLAERLRLGLEALGVSASFGVATYRGDLEDLFRRADRALYRAKEGGKNRVVRATGEDQGSR
ncbi:MAG: GGDEF domain-containing protein [Thermus sp.]|uniref:GGDEF domain-containing protein n=1 Tax=unclassified Thermus TaxID=2619321 RepID=UPI00023897A7|nr:MULTISPECIES: GGDEF domain-containing protein [unclassified Thermus]AEV15861.1 GGDEF domain protein [Thermus sp. CCB_US3_UF1]MCS7217915.1 GGDEF domain-containing protein [Thermus sp.]MCX7850152.1 GGDEF domain-containing protein [Thermus sp.]